MRAALANQNARMQAQLANQGAGLQASGIRQDAASQMANLGGDLRATQLADAAALQGVGAQQQAAAQRLLDDRFRRFAEEREFPFRMFDVLRSGAGLDPVIIGGVFRRAGSGGWQLFAVDCLSVVNSTRPLLERRKPTTVVSRCFTHLGLRDGGGEPERLGVHDCAVTGLHVCGVLNAATARRVSGRNAALGISVNDALCHGR